MWLSLVWLNMKLTAARGFKDINDKTDVTTENQSEKPVTVCSPGHLRTTIGVKKSSPKQTTRKSCTWWRTFSVQWYLPEIRQTWGKSKDQSLKEVWRISACVNVSVWAVHWLFTPTVSTSLGQLGAHLIMLTFWSGCSSLICFHSRVLKIFHSTLMFSGESVTLFLFDSCRSITTVLWPQS